MEADEAYLSGGPGHSTHLLQDLDQRGGPIQHWKRIEEDLFCHSYRIHGTLSRARIAQVVELAYVLSFTPAVCSHAAVHVGWGEDADGKLIYNPLACPHIFSKLVDDESSLSTAVVAAPAQGVSTEASAADRLAAFRAGALDGVVGVAAARQAAREVLGNGIGDGDGWDNEDDMPDGTIDEAGSRGRRNKIEKGRVTASKEWRESKTAEGKSAEDKEEAARITVFKTRRTDMKVLELNATAEGNLTSTDYPSNEEMIAFIRARTNKPVPQTEKTATLLKAKVETLRNKPVIVKVFMEPEGYQEWLQKEEAAAAEKAAEKAAAKAEKAAAAAALVTAAAAKAAAAKAAAVPVPPAQEAPPPPPAPPAPPAPPIPAQVEAEPPSKRLRRPTANRS
eukprot:7358073-Prymnesium_polylepis.1